MNKPHFDQTPLWIVITCATAVILASACGRTPHQKFNLDPTKLFSDMAALNTTEYCGTKKQIEAVKNSTAATTEDDTPKPYRRYHSPKDNLGDWVYPKAKTKKMAPPVATPDPSFHATAADADIVDNTHFTKGHGIDADDGHENDFGIGGGCVFKPIKEVWATVLNYQLMKWDNTVAKLTELDWAKNSIIRYEIGYTVHQDGAVQTWLMGWAHGLVQGTVEDPGEVMVVYSMGDGNSKTTFAGISVGEKMHYWKGQIRLQAVSPHITAVTLENKFNIETQHEQDSLETAQDILTKLRNGQPDWATAADKAPQTRLLLDRLKQAIDNDSAK